jgi:Ca2+-binding EF-hand superfamily protein
MSTKDRKPIDPTKKYEAKFVNQEKSNLKRELARVEVKKEVLRKLPLYCLDNSIRESTVGQLKSHTIENKIEIFAQVKKCGLKDIIVASFSNMPRIDDYFAQYLKDQGEDFSRLFSFSEVSNGIKDGRYDTESVPTSLLKNQKYGLYNTFFEIDLCDDNCKWEEKFTIDDMCKLVEKWMNWVYDNINPKARILINLRDLTDVINRHPDRLFKFVSFLARMPEEKRMYCLAYEDPMGEFLPEEVACYTRALRECMVDNGWEDGQLICHIHEKWGLQNSSQLAALSSGCTGIWASLCEEGAALGHASSAVTITNLVRLGNNYVLHNYNCKELRNAAKLVTQVTTTLPPHPKQPVYGERAMDLVFGFLGTGSFDLATFFGEKRANRMTPLATPKMIIDHLTSIFEESADFTPEIALQMKTLMETDLHNNRKEEYQSEVGIALLYDRAGGKLTGKMADIIATVELQSVHHKELINDVKKVWDEWDIKDGRAKDNCLEFDFFYTAFASPFLGCYRCKRTRDAFSCLDMDKDGVVDWNEFALYLKWALRQYPETKDMEQLLTIAFQQGLLPAMIDEEARRDGLDFSNNDIPDEHTEPQLHHELDPK